MSNDQPIDPVQLLQELVRIPSVNPDAGDAAAEHTGEGRIAQHIASLLARNGFTVRMPQVHPGRPNVVAFVPGDRRGTVGLCAHLDTVPVPGMSVPPFEGRLAEGRVFGRGAADTKGAVAAMVCAATAEAAAGGRGRPGILLLLTCAEETDFSGARHFIEQGDKGVSCMVIGEPTGNRLATAHKGLFRCDVVAEGHAVHSSVPEKGVNAIYRMSRAVTRLEALAETIRTRTPHPRLGSGRLTVGTISGGTAVNVVPDRCVIAVDRRLVPGESTATVSAELDDVLADLEGVHRLPDILSVPALDTSEEDPWVGCIKRALTTDETVVLPYATDASILQTGGFPCVVLGPGDPAAAHTDNESIAVEQVHQAVALYRRILQDAGR